MYIFCRKIHPIAQKPLSNFSRLLELMMMLVMTHDADNFHMEVSWSSRGSKFNSSLLCPEARPQGGVGGWRWGFQGKRKTSEALIATVYKWSRLALGEMLSLPGSVKWVFKGRPAKWVHKRRLFEWVLKKKTSWMDYYRQTISIKRSSWMDSEK